jgi:hypothetical protein
MSVTAVPALGDDAAVPAVGSFVESLVERLCAEYHGDPRVVRRQVDAVLATFADARVRAFVPILVEKQVRRAYHGPRDGVPALRSG